MKTWWWLVVGVLLGLLSAGVILLASSPPRGTAITLLPPPTPQPMQVHVAGAVQEPGVYLLSQESRARDAIEAAGGFTADAQIEGINLAAFLEDGTQLFIPGDNQLIFPSRIGSDIEPYPIEIININTASQTELETLPGIGPVTAEKIIAYRDEFGEFENIAELLKVAGIGTATYDAVKAFITVGD
ncbi:MAG: ComEA family DNA-binding protein [Chloroflexota bacterium]